MTDSAPNRYDQLPYVSNPFAQTHPDRLATIATLLGMSPAPVERCRVLELGCSSGGNLMPMACALPGSEFVGVDLSQRQIETGQAVVEAVGLKNVSLKHQDLMDIGPDFGQFDYIIAHGVFSWVPQPVQNKILEICRQNLAANGVAYISYNTYPGWRLHSTIRDMMLYHTRQTVEPARKITQARELLEFLGETILKDSNPHASFLHSYVHYTKERFLPAGDDAYLFHNELAEVNEPLYFYQFVERAAAHGLRYLAEAQFQTMLLDNLPADVAAKLRQQVKTTIELEQYMDFLRNRTFRQTLLCHQDVKLQGRLSPERLADFYVASPTVLEGQPAEFEAGAVVRFRGPKGETFATDHPLTQAAMLHLSQIWPQAVPFNQLVSLARARLNGRAVASDNLSDRQILGANLLKAYSRNEDLVEFHVYSPPFVKEVSQYPVASPMARFQAGQSAETVTNLRHEIIRLEGLSYYLLPYLDGSYAAGDLVHLLENLINDGTVSVKPPEPANVETATGHEDLPAVVESALQTLANASLLIG